MKEKIKRMILCGVIITILGTILYAWSTTRNIQVLQELDASAISRVEIWNCNKVAVISKPEAIQRFLDVLKSTRIHKRNSPDRAGSISVDIFYNNGIREEMAINAEHINFGDGKYMCDTNICSEIYDLHEEFMIVTPDVIEDIAKMQEETIWGITLEAKDVTPTGLTLVCIQSGGKLKGDLETGDWYILEKKELFGWKKVKYAYYEEDEIESNAVAEIIPSNTSTDWKIEWGWLYGELSPGTYRIGKEFTDFFKGGRFEEEMFFAEFEIEKE